MRNQGFDEVPLNKGEACRGERERERERGTESGKETGREKRL